jgi:hypothetical protein
VRDALSRAQVRHVNPKARSQAQEAKTAKRRPRRQERGAKTRRTGPGAQDEGVKTTGQEPVVEVPDSRERSRDRDTKTATKRWKGEIGSLWGELWPSGGDFGGFREGADITPEH